MLMRKVITSFITSYAIVVCFGLLTTLNSQSYVGALQGFLSWGFATSFIALPIVYVYGTGISLAVETVHYRRGLDNRVMLLTATCILGSMVIILIYMNQITEPAPTLAPYTKEDAVRFATSVDGTAIDSFPNFIGKVEEIISGYRVTRQTSAIEVGKDKFEVTFHERWNDGQLGSSWMVYTVERNRMTWKGSGGTEPPY